VDDGHVEATAGFWVALGDALSKLPAAIVRGPVVGDRMFRSHGWPWPLAARVLAWPVIKPVSIIIGIYERVDTFYPFKRGEYSIHVWLRAMVIAGIASAFDSIHSVVLDGHFPL
jgi:hypothetical protein